MKPLYFFAFGISILLLTTFIHPSPQAAKTGTYIVDAPTLSVRSEASTDARTLGYLKKGDKVAVFGTKYGWAKTYYDNEVAYIAAHYLYPEQENEIIHKNEYITIAGKGVRIRQGPGRNHPIRAIAGNGDSYELISTNNDWHQIAINGTEMGWVASWLTNKSKTNVDKKTSSGSLNGFTIMLDAGHGGRDPGTIALDNTYEKHFTMEVVRKTANRLKENGANIIMTRNNDTGLSLNKRVELSNHSKADAFISFHYNSSPHNSHNGTNTFYFRNNNSKQFAESLQKSLARHVRMVSRGTLLGDYRVLRNNENIAALVELGFLSNPNDLSVVQTDAHQANVATAITEGVLHYFNR